MQLLINFPLTFKPIYLSHKTITMLLLFIPSLAFNAKLEETLLMQKSFLSEVFFFFFLNFVQVTIKISRSEKVTREILHFSLRIFYQLFWAVLMAESSQNCSLNGTWPIPAMLTHQHFDKVKCPSIAGHYPSSVFSPNVIERQREVTSYRGFRIHCNAEQPETLLVPMQTQSLGQLTLCWPFIFKRHFLKDEVGSLLSHRHATSEQREHEAKLP